jgi:hypothetical protein
MLDALVRSGTRLFYSGDFDPAGLEIAAIVLTRYPGAAHLWRMTPADYRRAVRQDAQASINPDRLKNLAERFPDLVAEMIAIGRTGDQEKLIDALAGDLVRFTTNSRCFS